MTSLFGGALHAVVAQGGAPSGVLPEFQRLADLADGKQPSAPAAAQPLPAASLLAPVAPAPTSAGTPEDDEAKRAALPRNTIIGSTVATTDHLGGP